MTEPINVFEWCWEHGPASVEDRATLMRLAFTAVKRPPSVPFPMLAGTDLHSMGRLASTGHLKLDHENQKVGFPGYEVWLASQVLPTYRAWLAKQLAATGHEVAW